MTIHKVSLKRSIPCLQTLLLCHTSSEFGIVRTLEVLWKVLILFIKQDIHI